MKEEILLKTIELLIKIIDEQAEAIKSLNNPLTKVSETSKNCDDSPDSVTKPIK